MCISFLLKCCLIDVITLIHIVNNYNVYYWHSSPSILNILGHISNIYSFFLL